ncbi:MAG: hypothetical protein KDA61_00370, partial [Planctomycetales bacterium]|nr:hypothetical protein [Planctomycetales bacterium]
MSDDTRPAEVASGPPRKRVARAVSPAMRKLLVFVFGVTALLGANSAYLAAVTFAEWWRSETYQNLFYQYMFLAHLALGLVLIVPFIVFGFVHMAATRDRRNRRAVKIGYALFIVSIVVLATGLALMRVGGFDLKQATVRQAVYWLHVLCPLAALWLYWLHRLAGARIKWRLGLSYAAFTAVAVAAAVWFQAQDPRNWFAVGPESGVKYFEPSLTRTASGNFIPAESLMADKYCAECHEDVHAQWQDSVHRFSSFNNPPYLASILESREVVLQRDGDVHAARFCAGCHDPVPFLSGAFDDPDFDMLSHTTSQAGITCTACHAITHVNSTRGNGDYTIEEPQHYP